MQFAVKDKYQHFEFLRRINFYTPFVEGRVHKSSMYNA